MNFFAELKRRHIYRVAAAYAVVAWVLLQLFNNLEPILKLPEWAGTLVLVFLVGGFPVALLLAWVRELAPADSAGARATTGKRDWVLIGALVVVIALVSYQQLAPTTGVRTAQQQASVSPTAAPAAKPDGVSIAVLPFVNLSSDKEQEFFSDGMTEEITSALAKISGLNVVARTSAFQFKGENRDVQSIAQTLHATHVIEGSVRKVLAQWVQLGADGGASVRAVTDGACPQIVFDGVAMPMAVRARPDTKFGNVKPATFPVTGCETEIPRGAIAGTLDGKALPLPRPDPRRIVVLGDTGCRLLKGVSAQECNNPKAWPFPDVAKAAAASHPDLVIHVGDYMYREDACPTDVPGCAQSPYGYGWEPWYADFFEPASPLFAAAPWVMVRGNHEDCDRAGEGCRHVGVRLTLIKNEETSGFVGGMP